MIEVRNVSEKGVTYFCESCEEKFSGKVECRFDVSLGWGRALNQFWAKHDDCDGERSKNREWEVDVGLLSSWYRMEPKLPFKEIRRRWEGILEFREVRDGDQ